MRNLLSLVTLIVLLGVAAPAEAQLRANVQNQETRTQLYGQQNSAFSLNDLFSPEHFQMSHSYEMSFGSFGGSSSSMGMYTNTMRFQFNSQLAARVDMAYAFSPFGQASAFGGASEQGQLFLRNAEIAYRPSENVQLHIQVRQSPYGRYMSPYGYSPYGYSPYRGGYGNHMHVGFDSRRADDMFWNDGLR
ncbi:MAG: hypothetical protein WD021_11220 [Rhodothermales bacterium]